MTSGSCPRCRSTLEADASFCHYCGLDLALEASPGTQTSGPASAYQPTTPPFPMFPTPGLEMPANPMGHRRALATLAGVLILFNSSVVLIFGVIYMMGRSVAWEEVWIDGDWFEQRVVYWEWVLASIVMLASFGTGVAGGIASVKATRYTLAMVSALLLLACAVILQADWGIFMDEPYGQIAFVLVLAILPIPLLMMARPGFTAPMAPPGRGPSTHPMDNYGWSTTHGPGGGAAMGRGRRGSP